MTLEGTCMKNVYSLGFIGLLVLAGAISVAFQQYSDHMSPPHWLTLASVLVWLILLVLVSVSYTRRANELRVLYWSVESGPVNLANFYSRQVWLAFGLVVLSCFLAALATSVPWRIYPTDVLGILLPAMTFFVVLAFLFTSIVLYLQEEGRVFEAAYFDFVRQFGVNVGTLEDLNNRPQDFQSPRFGLWADVVVTHEGHPILFGGGQIGNLPCFALIMKTQTKSTNSCRQLTQTMSEKTSHRFKDIQGRIKKVDLWCDEGTFFLIVPFVSRSISVQLLRDAMDVLVGVTTDLREGKNGILKGEEWE